MSRREIRLDLRLARECGAAAGGERAFDQAHARAAADLRAQIRLGAAQIGLQGERRRQPG